MYLELAFVGVGGKKGIKIGKPIFYADFLFSGPTSSRLNAAHGESGAATIVIPVKTDRIHL